MILHTLNATPEGTAFRDCVRLIKEGDALLLLGDGVYAALTGTKSCKELVNTKAELYILEADASAAGILGLIDTQVTIVDIDAFVALSERFPKQQAWY